MKTVGWGNLYFTEAEAPGAAAKAFAARCLKLLGEETVAAARESRDPIAVLSEEEKLAAKLAKEQDVAMPVPEGPKDRYFGKKQRPNSTAAARSVTAGRRAANQAAAAGERQRSRSRRRHQQQSQEIREQASCGANTACASRRRASTHCLQSPLRAEGKIKNFSQNQLKFSGFSQI